MDIRQILQIPIVYQKFQEFGGFFGARIKAINTYIPPLPAGSRIFDIGCGPGHILKYIKQPVEYHGFDIDKTYIDFANKHFGHLGQFHLREFNQKISQELGKADLVMMNGVLHHLSDTCASNLMQDVRESLSETGKLFTFDGCLREGQHPFAHWMHTHDRGEYVRTEDAYTNLLKRTFPTVEAHIREDLSWTPHTYYISLCSGNTQISPPSIKRSEESPHLHIKL